MVAGISMYADAFEFSNTDSNYDFTQTIEIYIIDQKNSKFFGMMDPFEMVVTTIPSRFYVAVMGVIERGHRNSEGVFIIDGPVRNHTYSIIFRSLNSAHVLHVGNNWIVDGSKMISLNPDEITAIYELLNRWSDDAEPMDLDKLNPLFDEIEQQIKANDSVSADGELKSIIEAANSLKERLPEGHDDTKSLPYYNKWMENQKFHEEQEKVRKLKEAQAAEKSQQMEKEKIVQVPGASAKINLPAPENMPIQDQIYADPEATPNDIHIFLLLSAILSALALSFYWMKRRSR